MRAGFSRQLRTELEGISGVTIPKKDGQTINTANDNENNGKYLK
jgi:hypothetical protein